MPSVTVSPFGCWPIYQYFTEDAKHRGWGLFDYLTNN